jgi:amidase
MVRISRLSSVGAFAPTMSPAASVKPGELILFETHDCWHGQITSEAHDIGKVDFTCLNPATGPVFIEGAEPGDVLSVSVLSIDVASQGVINVIPGGGLLGDRVKKSFTKIIPVSSGMADFSGRLLPIKPMIGVIGVATSLQQGVVSTGVPGRHGGNMDTKDISQGTTLYLPVSQKGAMLAMGDVHALMADGEACVTGLEIAAEVLVRTGLIKHTSISWPAIRSGSELMIVASGATLEEAARAATDSAVSYISSACGLKWEEAYMMASLAVDLRISQCVDPQMTVRAVLPLDKLGISGDLADF